MEVFSTQGPGICPAWCPFHTTGIHEARTEVLRVRMISTSARQQLIPFPITTTCCSLTSGVQSFYDNNVELSFLSLLWTLVDHIEHGPGLRDVGCALESNSQLSTMRLWYTCRNSTVWLRTRLPTPRQPCSTHSILKWGQAASLYFIRSH